MCCTVSQIKDWLTAALFPPKCPLCFERGSVLHTACIRPYVSLEFDHDKQLIWLSRYNEPAIKRLIERCKFYGFTNMVAPWIQTVLEKTDENESSEIIAWKELTRKKWTVVPVPLHWSRRLWRGFNQAEVIAKNLQKHDSSLVFSDFLTRVKKTKQQAKLSKTDRQKNITGAFFWKSNHPVPANVILVDDVYTSGATLNEAKKTLQQAGAKEVWCLVLARKFSYLD